MSVEFELEADNVALAVDAYTNEALVTMDVLGDVECELGIGVRFTAAQLRQLRRFLEHCYPASEDPPHDLDPWALPHELVHDLEETKRSLRGIR